MTYIACQDTTHGLRERTLIAGLGASAIDASTAMLRGTSL